MDAVKQSRQDQLVVVIVSYNKDCEVLVASKDGYIVVYCHDVVLKLIDYSTGFTR